MEQSVKRPWFKFWPKGVPRNLDYPGVPLYGFLSNMAGKYPHKIAFSDQRQSLNYKNLDESTSKLGLALKKLGIKKGDIVLIFLPNCIEFVIGYYGILKAGGVVSPANPLYRKDELKHQLNDCKAIGIITDRDLYDIVKSIRNDTFLTAVILTVGIPIMDTDARIMDESNSDIALPQGEVGELVIKGPQVMRGYLNRPMDNRQILREGWLYTGDLALMDEEGYFHIVDRKKEIIKYKGYTIAPSEIEALLYQHPAVKECAVIGKPDKLAGEIPKGCIVLKEGHSPSKEEIIAFCEQKVAPYKRVRDIEFINEIPKNQVGKILRRILRNKERRNNAG